MYDILAVSRTNFNKDRWQKIKEKYPTALLCENLKSFTDLYKKAFTKMFWVIWDDIVLADFDLNGYKATEWDNMYVHIFKNGPHSDGIALIPKELKISEEEFEKRIFDDKKELDIVASYPVEYDKFTITTFQDYEDALEKSNTEMFWAIWSEIEITDNTAFQLYFSHHDYYNRNENHVFKNLQNGDQTYINGPVLFSKAKPVSQREIKYRYLINKKEHDRVVSRHKPYDIVFISYAEPNADENYKKLLANFPNIKRVHGIKGIHQAHIAAAKQCISDMFWVIDADAEILKDFNFDLTLNVYDLDTVHVWRSKNPINDLIYGYGGIKLLPRQLTINMDITKPDMTTSISTKFKPMPEISNITAFNTDPFNTWKSAFRECAKLASKTIHNQKEDETDERLKTWTTVGHDRPFGEYAIRGARAGMEFGLSNSNNIQLINDFDWLKEKFDSEV